MLASVINTFAFDREQPIAAFPMLEISPIPHW